VHYLNYYREYNIYKKLVKETWYNKKDVSIRNFVYQYDDNQNLLQEKETYPTGFDAVINYHFNDEDLLESSLKYFSDPGFFYYDDYIYDDQKRLIEIKSFNHDGELSGKKLTYNPNRKLVKLFEHSPYILVPSEGKSILSKRDKEGQDLLNEEYSYTEFDSISEIKYYKQDFVDPNKRFLYNKVIYNYDTQKRKAVEYHYSLESLLSTVNFKYYPGNLIEEINYSSVNNSSTYKYFYNKDGFISKVIFVTNKKTTILEFKYVFDQNNNWIQQEKSVDNVALYRRTRDIEYYSAKMN
ncbi:MAG TPA: hypothetical protein VLR49_07645, partial [Ferruginibacter sp.]|nr:hypothetical protein [Ferruginibacter sp.]